MAHSGNCIFLVWCRGRKGFRNVNESTVLMCIKIWPENHSEVPELEMSHIVRYEEEKTNPLGQNADLN